MRNLVDKIRQAFKDVLAPSRGTIVSGHSPEHKDVAESLHGTHWKDIHVDLLRTISPFFLTPQAFQFYLPAYLLAAIEDFNEADVIPASIIGCLDPIEYEKIDNMKKFMQIQTILELEQRSVLSLFFVYLLDHHGADLDRGTLKRLAAYYSDKAKQSG